MTHFAARCMLAAGLATAFVSWTSMANADDSYGAIAYSESTGNWGSSRGYDSRSSAEHEALRQCGENDCDAVSWFRNECGALATGDDNGWGAASGDNRREAERQAISTCMDAADNCKLATSECSVN